MHLLDGLVERQALHLVVVELGDEIVGEDAGLRGGGVVDRRHDLDQAVFHRHFDAEAAELAARLHLHVAEALGVHVARMRIEAGEHPVIHRGNTIEYGGLVFRYGFKSGFWAEFG